MKRMRYLPIITALLLGATFAAEAADTRPASPVVENAWIRLLPGDLPAAGYFGLRDRSGAARKLVGADSPAFMMTMLHMSSEQNGQSQMMHVEDVALPAHGTLRFAPGGYHLMLMHANKALNVGDRIPVTLKFSDGSSVEVGFVVRPAGASGP